MSRYTDVDSLKRELKRSAMLALVERAETVDAVQVVRCMDCRHKCGEHDGYICCDKNIWHEPDWYCADGKRKEQNDG